MAGEKQSKTRSFRSCSPSWSSKSSLCGSDRTGFASSSRLSQGESEAGSGGGHPAYRQSRLSQNRPGPDQLTAEEMSCSDGGAVGEVGLSCSPATSTAGGVGSRSTPALHVTPAQMALQQQLRTKHGELSRRIAGQQAELARLGEQLAATSYPAPSPPQQQLYLEADLVGAGGGSGGVGQYTAGEPGQDLV